jgi:hypothetical protein
VIVRPRLVLKLAGAALGLLLMAGLTAPYLSADRYGERLRASLERALGGNRRVEIGRVHFSLFKGPAFSVDSVIIHEDPAIGAEPTAYIQESSGGGLEVAPRLWSLLGGRFVIASISLDGASINLSKSGPASEWGRWNFSSFVSRSVMSAAPKIHVRDSRVNFKFGDDKSVFYLMDTDLDISPPTVAGGGWRVSCSAKPARTDRPAQGLGSFTVNGRWYVAPERVDLDVDLNRSGLGEITALVRGQAGGVHGTLSARLHMAGPIDNIGVAGRLHVEDVHRWDLLPSQGNDWPLDIGGRLDLISQQLELQSHSASNVALPLSLSLHASNYLSQPHWNLGVDWNRFPVAPLMELASHMGVQFPPGLTLSGTIDGALNDSDQAAFAGQLAFHDAALTIPNAPPIRFENAYLIVGNGVARLSPALVRTAGGEEARIEAAYDTHAAALDVSISADAMQVASLRAQVALAAVPWLEKVRSGEWSGLLRYHHDAEAAGWTGRLQLTGGEIDAPGLADPVKLAAARARIDGDRVALDHVEASAGKLSFTGEYSYEPGTAHPHRVRLNAKLVDAADLEAEMAPTLRRAGLLARALGRTSIPDWLKERSVEGTVRIDDLVIAGSHWEKVQAHLLWDVTRVVFGDIQASLDRALLTGKLSVNLRGARPSYSLAAKLSGVVWQAGKVDVEGKLETSGTGAQLLANLTSEGTFTGAGVDFGADPPFRAITGAYNLEWWQSAPRLRLTGLNLRADSETYTGRGATQDDGRLTILVANGDRQIRMSGTLANLKVEEPSEPRP